MEAVLDDLAQAELLGHRDLRRQQARGLDLAVEQRLEPRAEAAGVDRLDVGERQVLLQPIRHVEMAAGAHADRDRNVLRSSGLRIADRAARRSPTASCHSVGHDPSHAGARVADGAPHARALDHVLLGLRVRLVLRALEIVEALPARLRAAECLQVELDIEAFGREEAFLHRDEIVQPHALGSDLDPREPGRHGVSSPCCSSAACAATCRGGSLALCRRATTPHRILGLPARLKTANSSLAAGWNQAGENDDEAKCAGDAAGLGPRRDGGPRAVFSVAARHHVRHLGGGGVTHAARAVGRKLSQLWGQPVVIENKGGAAHILGAQAVARAAPDGHTLLVAKSAVFVLNQWLYPQDGRLGYEVGKDLTPAHRPRAHLPGHRGEQRAAGVEHRRDHRARAPAAGQAHLRHRGGRLRAAHEHAQVRAGWRT